MTDGSKRDFPETSRAGGSWCTTIRYEDCFVIIADANGNETAIPSHNIDEIKIDNPRSRGW